MSRKGEKNQRKKLREPLLGAIKYSGAGDMRLTLGPSYTSPTEMKGGWIMFAHSSLSVY